MKKRLEIIVALVFLVLNNASGKDIYSLIMNGEIEEARDSLSRQSTAQQRDGNYLFYLSLVEPEAGRAVELMQASLNAGVSGIYREEISHRLMQYYLLHRDHDAAESMIGDYLAGFENGKYLPDFIRYSIYLDGLKNQYESGIRQADRLLLEYKSDAYAQWGLIDKARLMMAFDKKIAARDMLKKLSREKSGPGVASALYLLTLDAAQSKRTDDAVFYYNLLKEAYPAAIGLDALLDQMSGLGSQSQKEKSADEVTGTFYSIQVGVFAAAGNAKQLAQQFEKYGHKVETTTKKISDRTYYVVYVGHFDSFEDAAAFEKTIETENDDVYQVIAR